MNALEKGGNTGDMRAGHGGARDYTKRDAPSVVAGSGRGIPGGVSGEYVHTRCSNVRLKTESRNRVIFECAESGSDHKNWEADLEDRLLYCVGASG